MEKGSQSKPELDLNNHRIKTVAIPNNLNPFRFLCFYHSSVYSIAMILNEEIFLSKFRSVFSGPL